MKLYNFIQFVNEMLVTEGGNAIDEARPLTQTEVQDTYKWVEKNILPLLGLDGEGIDASPIGSYGKKADDATSGDIDVAISIDKIAGVNGISLDDVLDFVDNTLRKNGYSTTKASGFNQVSLGVPVAGKKNEGTAQVDLMLSGNLDWSKFMYYSPNFRESESKYKGMYRNTLKRTIT